VGRIYVQSNVVVLNVLVQVIPQATVEAVITRLLRWRTVEIHRANLMGKLELRSRVELVRYAMEHGLLG
jgi:FixJ family two-component response regulator